MRRERPARQWVPPAGRDSDALEHLARVGLIAYGVVHLLVAWLALQLAWFGGGGESADQSGAMSTLAESPVGKPLLWVRRRRADRARRLAGRRGAALAQRLVGVGQGAARRRCASPATR